jgi:hypothetical protein
LPDLSFCGLEDLAGHPSAVGGGVGVRIPGPSDAEARHVNFWHPAAADDAITNDGSQSQPWQTIGFGVSQLTAGQALYVRRERPSDPSHRSVYAESIKVSLAGAPHKPFWVLGEPGVALEHPAPGPATTPLIDVSDAAFVSIVDFELDGHDNVLAYGVHVENSHHVVLDRLTVRRHRRSGISISSTKGRTCHDVGVVKCHFAENREPADPNIEPHGIQVVWNTERVLVYRNETTGNEADGIQLQQGIEDFPIVYGPANAVEPRDVTVEENYFHADGENGIDLKNCLRVTAKWNQINDYEQVGTVVHVNASDVILQGNEINSCGTAASIGASNGRLGRVLVRFNQADFCQNGVRASHCRQIELYHNTLFNVGSYGIRLADEVDKMGAPSAAVDTATVLNNIVARADVGLDYVLPGQHATAPGVKELLSDGNVLFDCGGALPVKALYVRQPLPWKDASNLMYDCSSVIDDPKFRDPTHRDYTPMPGGSANDRALAIAGLPPAYPPHGTAQDIGALEHP